MHIHACVHARTHTYMHAYVRTHIHTHARAYIMRIQQNKKKPKEYFLKLQLNKISVQIKRLFIWDLNGSKIPKQIK
jgi:hypothetical protein